MSEGSSAKNESFLSPDSTFVRECYFPVRLWGISGNYCSLHKSVIQLPRAKTHFNKLSKQKVLLKVIKGCLKMEADQHKVYRLLWFTESRLENELLLTETKHHRVARKNPPRTQPTYKQSRARLFNKWLSAVTRLWVFQKKKKLFRLRKTQQPSYLYNSTKYHPKWR